MDKLEYQNIITTIADTIEWVAEDRMTVEKFSNKVAAINSVSIDVVSRLIDKMKTIIQEQ